MHKETNKAHTHTKKRKGEKPERSMHTFRISLCKKIPAFICIATAVHCGENKL